MGDKGRVIPITELVDHTVIEVELVGDGDDSYAVIRFENGATLYVDAPTAYRAPA